MGERHVGMLSVSPDTWLILIEQFANCPQRINVELDGALFQPSRSHHVDRGQDADAAFPWRWLAGLGPFSARTGKSAARIYLCL